MKTLILGGARSGKSKLAEQMAKQSGHDVIYIATSQSLDYEMDQRIQHHRARRPSSWQLIEEPINLGEVLRNNAAPNRCLLVDCLTLWLTNLLMLDNKEQFEQQRQQFLDQLSVLPGQIILVSNETGMGIVPMGKLSRRFCDEAGWLHQSVAEKAQTVILTVAGLPHYLKGN